MKKLIKSLLYVLLFFAVIITGLKITGNGYLIKGVYNTYLHGKVTANIYDGESFDTRPIPNDPTNVYHIPHATQYNAKSLPKELTDVLNETKAASYLVIKNDSIYAEHYFNGHSEYTLSNSFSMAKTITTLLTQIAIQEGKIKSWDEPAKKYVPWISGTYSNEITLRHLSCMQGGLNWNEHYTNPFCITAKSYYGNDIETTMKNVEAIRKPGKEFEYQSGSTQLLGLALRKAIGENIADFASKKLHQPLQMETAGKWHTDHKNGMELTFCCYNAISRDFAKIGLMLLHHGKFNGKQIVDSTFCSNIGNPLLSPQYGFSVWVGETKTHKFYTMQGTLGQYVTIIPSENIVMVRTGSGKKPMTNGLLHDDIYVYVDSAVKLTK